MKKSKEESRAALLKKYKNLAEAFSLFNKYNMQKVIRTKVEQEIRRHLEKEGYKGPALEEELEKYKPF